MPYRVLIVEDNPKFSEVIASIFEEDLGYGVTVVDNAREAQQLLFRSQREDTRFDLIVTDMNLLGDNAEDAQIRLGGLRVLQTLRQMRETELCVILSGETLNISEVKRIHDEYSDILSGIIPKGDDVYHTIMSMVHPKVVNYGLRLFLSYRRQDSGLFTDRIYDKLLEQFNARRVFRDLDSIGGGADFREAIRDAIRQSDCVLVVIGDQWATLTGENGQPRLLQTSDYVRFEVEEALRHDKNIIPVLLNDTAMPTTDQLPVDMASFVYKNAIRVRQGQDFNPDMKRLIEAVQQAARLPR